VDLGLMLINAGRFDDAIAKLGAGLALTGEKGSEVIRATALYGLAAAWANKGDYPRAIRLIDESLALSPDYAPATALRDGLRRATGSSHPWKETGRHRSPGAAPLTILPPPVRGKGSSYFSSIIFLVLTKLPAVIL
jgi:tetratricopeptide (TPR) repeat protein